MKSAFLVSVFSLLASVLAFPNPGLVRGNIDVHDPSICRDSSGKYFLFSTGNDIPIRTSTNRIDWTLIGNVWKPGHAKWAHKYTNTSSSEVLWAPDCTYKNGEFYLYYAASTFGSRKSAIFFAKSTTGMPGSWTHQGEVITSSEKDRFNAIDPNLLIDDEKWWLVFGSYGTGIKLLELDPNTGKPPGGRSGPHLHTIAERPFRS